MTNYGESNLEKQLDWPIVRTLGKQSYLFGSLLIFMLMGPVVGPAATPGARLIVYVVLILVFVTGPLAASRTRGNLLFTAVLGVLLLVTGDRKSVV